MYSLSELWCGDGTRSALPPEWPVYSLNRIAVGDRIGPASYVVDAGVMERYAAVMGVERPLYPTVPAKIESTLGHPAAQKHEADKVRTLNARMMLELRHPCRGGDVLTFEGQITDIYERRGKRYVVCQGTTTRQDGQVIERIRKTWSLALKEAAEKWDFLRSAAATEYPDPVGSHAQHSLADRVNGTADAGTGPAIKATAISLGQRIAELTIDYSWDHITEYEFVVPHAMGMHNSFAQAKAAGFSQPFASGTMVVAHIVENLLPGVFGAGWTHHGSLNMVNTRPIVADSRVVLAASVVAKLPQGDNTIVVMDINASLQGGETVAVGSAGALALG